MRDACDIEKLNLYLDQDSITMTDHEKRDLETHLETCPNCRTYLEDLQVLRKGLGDMPLKALPDQFNEELHAKLVEASMKTSRNNSKIHHFVHSTTFKVMSGVAAVFIIAVVAFGTLGQPVLNMLLNGAYQKTAESAVEASGPEFGMPTANFSSDGNIVMMDQSETYKLKAIPSGAVPAPTEPSSEPVVSAFDPSIYGKMIIRNGALSLEVENFDNAYTQIESTVVAVKGYVENADSYTSPYYENNTIKGETKGGNLTVRVPSDRFDAVMEQLKEIGKVTHASISSYDVTESYIDTESRIKNLEARELRLRELLVKAENVKDIMEVDSQLANVRTEIDSSKAILNSYDKSLQLSSISISLYEKNISDVNIEGLDGNLFERIRANFVRSINSVVRLLQSTLVGIFAILPFALVLIVVVLTVFWIIRRWLRKRGGRSNV